MKVVRGKKSNQTELWEVAARQPVVPAVRPTADEELAETFAQAASAWARWRERTMWSGRMPSVA